MISRTLISGISLPSVGMYEASGQFPHSPILKPVLGWARLSAAAAKPFKICLATAMATPQPFNPPPRSTGLVKRGPIYRPRRPYTCSLRRRIGDRFRAGLRTRTNGIAGTARIGLLQHHGDRALCHVLVFTAMSVGLPGPERLRYGHEYLAVWRVLIFTLEGRVQTSQLTRLLRFFAVPPSMYLAPLASAT